MKKYLLLAVVTILTQGAKLKAQENDDFQTVFSGGIHRISGFGGPIYNYTIVNNKFTLLTGGGGGVLLNDFFIGGYGMGSTTGINYYNKALNTNQDLSISYGGLWAGYSHHAKQAIHIAFFLETGWGNIKSPIDLMNNESYTINDRIFVVDPEIELEVNIARFFRISLGVNYRIVGGLDNNSLSFANASGPGANLMFKFGWF
jgi:hypothetical protein